ncbi:O-antigen polymerase [Photobacterium damselae]|uniref:O-antigen polymerase n=1 Tax=Photobacterium damselae TaxID=38293 RepID=UPI00083A88BC|nr:O-antigen polymerase [Photobacterium damselae]ODA22636.1 hypothetical protein A0J46_18400 [Photobacterium damselae subsp. damselae]
MSRYYLFYIIFSLLVFYFGPVNYTLINPIITLLFIIVAYGALFLGLYIGFNFIKCSNLKHEKVYINNRIFSILILILISINTINIVDVFSSIGFESIYNISLGELYYSNANSEKEGGIITQLLTVTYPVVMYIIAYSCSYFKNLNFYNKFAFFLFIVLSVSQYVLKGTNFGVFLILIPIIVNIYIKQEYNNIFSVKNLLFLSFVIYFISVISSRLSYYEVPYSVGALIIDRDHVIFDILPKNLAIGVTSALSYVSQGYYGLSLAFDYPFDSTLGLGSGYFVISKLGVIIDPDIFIKTYQAKMDSIWSSRIQWHTIFVWIANDVSFYFTPFIMFILGIISGVVYKSVRKNNDLLSKSLFSILTIILIFLPANNIVSGNPLVFMSFWVLLILWLFRMVVKNE